MALASVEGLGGLTLGRLADELGMSKSGVYAHFKSKQRLQLATLEAAREVFAREVFEPAMAHADGLPRLRALCDAFLSYVERHVFPGGCFFASLLGEFDARSGLIHDEVVAGHRTWLDTLVAAARAAQERGDLDRGADLEQLAFELDAALELGNYRYVLYRDPDALRRARAAVDGAIGRCLTTDG